MTKMSRKADLIARINMRLAELEFQLLIPPEDDTDEEFDLLLKEAIRLREMLRLLTDFE